jgi:hypothetical protein
MIGSHRTKEWHRDIRQVSNKQGNVREREESLSEEDIDVNQILYNDVAPGRVKIDSGFCPRKRKINLAET